MQLLLNKTIDSIQGRFENDYGRMLNTFRISDTDMSDSLGIDDVTIDTKGVQDTFHYIYKKHAHNLSSGKVYKCELSKHDCKTWDILECN